MPGEHRALTPEDVAHYPRPGMAIPTRLRYSPDSSFITFLFSEAGDLTVDLWAVDLASGRRERWLPVDRADGDQPVLSREQELRRERTRTRETGIADYGWAEKAAVLLAVVGDELWRWEGGAPRVMATGSIIDPKISADGSRAWYVSDGELWCIDDREPARLTQAAVPGITNGLAEYVAQEELDRESGYWPSPDGARVAFEEVDERHIPVYPIVHQGQAEIAVEEHRYPFAGAENARVRLGIVAVDGGPPTYVDLPHEDGYVARAAWHPDGRLFVQWLSRDWRRLSLIAVDPQTGEGTTLLVDEGTPWINLHDDLRFIAGSGDFTWSSETSGFRHLSLHSPDGRLIRRLTQGEWPAERSLAIDPVRRHVYFEGWRRTPTERCLFRVSLDGGEAELLTREAGMHRAVIAPDFESYVDVHDNRTSAPSVKVRNMAGAVEHVLHEPAAPERALVAPGLHTFPTAGGAELNAAVYKPPAAGAAPIIVLVYGGPGAQTVADSWDMTVDLRAQMLAEHGFVVLKVDNRGSARRGLQFESVIHRHLGGVEVEDQLEGVRWLAGLGLGDLARVGICGWSYGGYMTLMTMLRAPSVFKVGVAGAPVTDWAGYDTAYTEKYMATPKDNAEGYRNSSPLSFATDLEGALLIVHGMIDENVHFRHTARMIQALIDAGKPYETLIYPNERHMPRSERDRADMERRILEFFERHLRAGS